MGIVHSAAQEGTPLWFSPGARQLISRGAVWSTPNLSWVSNLHRQQWDARRWKRGEAGCQEEIWHDSMVQECKGYWVKWVPEPQCETSFSWQVLCRFSITISVCIPPHVLSLCNGKLIAGWLRAELAMCSVSPGAQLVLSAVAGARFLHALGLASPFRCP